MINKTLKTLLFASAFAISLLATPLKVCATADGPVFFMGEDIIHPEGMVITVNEITRTPYHGGLGATAQKEDVKINLTLMNSGRASQQIDLLADFRLTIGEHLYSQIPEELPAKQNEIMINAGTQSRIDLTFRVEHGNKEVPDLNFNMNGSLLRIICDPKLGEIVAGTEIDPTDIPNITRAANILIEAGRFTAAKSLLELALVKSPDNSSLLLLMAKLINQIDGEEKAAYYLRKIDVTRMSGSEEATEAAKTAIRIGYSNIAVNILASYEAAGLLDDDQKALMARAYYYEDMVDDASHILTNLINNGYNDKTAYFTLGNVYNKQKDYKTAIYYWEKAVELDPTYPEALFNIGVGYLYLNDLPKARIYWEKVLQSNPDSVTLRAAEEALKGTEF